MYTYTPPLTTDTTQFASPHTTYITPQPLPRVGQRIQALTYKKGYFHPQFDTFTVVGVVPTDTNAIHQTHQLFLQKPGQKNIRTALYHNDGQTRGVGFVQTPTTIGLPKNLLHALNFPPSGRNKLQRALRQWAAGVAR